jgi:acetate kinase
VREGLSQRSGLLGLSGGRTGDSRDLIAAVEGDADAALALAVFAHRARRELAAAATSLPTLDALVFTGETGTRRRTTRRARDRPAHRRHTPLALTHVRAACQVDDVVAADGW